MAHTITVEAFGTLAQDKTGKNVMAFEIAYEQTVARIVSTISFGLSKGTISPLPLAESGQLPCLRWLT